MNNAEVLMRAYSGIQTLKERNRAVAKEHGERIKRLEALMKDVNHATHAGRQGDLFGSSSLTLSPDAEALLINPLAGL